MNITAITPTSPVCFGIGCSLHESCARYRGVEDMPHDCVVIGTCTAPDHQWPLFVPVRADA